METKRTVGRIIESIILILLPYSIQAGALYVSTKSNVHLVVTDPLGRRSGYDPVGNKTYEEIPNASYGEQSINTPAEEGFVHERAVSKPAVFRGLAVSTQPLIAVSK